VGLLISDLVADEGGNDGQSDDEESKDVQSDDENEDLVEHAVPVQKNKGTLINC